MGCAYRAFANTGWLDARHCAAINSPPARLRTWRSHRTGSVEMTAQDRFDLPALSGAQMREVDRAMIEDLHIELTQMMENAGRSLAELAITRFSPRSVTVLAGPGGNGGGGMVAARHLANRGCAVQVVLSDPDNLAPIPAHQADILCRMGVAIVELPAPAQLVVDALIGYSLHGSPEGRVGELIEWANGQPSPILALDTPTGLDVTTGIAAAISIVAAATLTLALPKVGLLEAPTVGDLYLADISVPESVYRRMGILLPQLFRDSVVIRLGP